MTRRGVGQGRAWVSAVVLGAYVVLTLALTYPLVVQFGSAIPGDGFDGWQNYWNLWWMKVATVEDVTWPLFTDLLYHPTGVSLNFHTLNPLNGLLALPVQLAFGLLPAYNLVVVLGFALGGFGAYLLARHVLLGRHGYSTAWRPGDAMNGSASDAIAPVHAGIGWHVAAFTAGIVYTFAPFHFAHLLGHMQVISLQWIPFYVLYVIKLQNAAAGGSDGHARRWSELSGAGAARPVASVTETRRNITAVGKHAVMASLFLVMVGLSDWYYLFYCLLFTGLWFIYVAVRRKLTTSLIFGLALVGILSFGLLSPMLVPMIREAQSFRFMVPDPGQTRTYSADLLAFVTPQPFHPLWGTTGAKWAEAFSGSTSERLVFVGYVPLLLALLAALPRRWQADQERQRSLFPTASGALWWLSLVVFALLALGPVLHVGGKTPLVAGEYEIRLPYELLHRFVPFFNISRSVSRFSVMVMLSLSVLAAIGSARLMRLGKGLATGGRGRRTAQAAWLGAGFLAAALIVFEFLPAPYPTSPPDTPAWYEELADEPGDFAILNLPMNWDRPGYLLYQTVHGKPLTAAYISRDDPRTLVERAPVLQSLRYLGPDVIEADLSSVGSSVLHYLDVRYVVLDRFKMPAGGLERQLTEQIAADALQGQDVAHLDERLRVFSVDPPAMPRPFLILGKGWGARSMDGERPWRAVGAQSTLLVHTEREATIRLALTARATGEAGLTVWKGDAAIGGFTVNSQERALTTGWVTVSPGDTTLRLDASTEVADVELSGLRLEIADE